MNIKPDVIGRYPELVFPGSSKRKAILENKIMTDEAALLPVPKGQAIPAIPFRNSARIVQKSLMFGIGGAIEDSFRIRKSLCLSLDGMNYTPDATAEKMMSFIVAVFYSWRKSDRALPSEEALYSFETDIRHAVSRGLSDSIDSLAALGELDEDAIRTVEETTLALELRIDHFIGTLRHAVQTA